MLVKNSVELMNPTFWVLLRTSTLFRALIIIHAKKKCELIDPKPRDDNGQYHVYHTGLAKTNT